MTFSLLNFGMLAGLMAVTIPIVVHLLNRRRYDVVEWGAMQFLQLGERTRQRIKLSDLLLLLLRIAMISLLVLVFTRPFVKGNTFIRSLYPEPIDLVIVIDGSYSMGWTGEAITPHARAIQYTHNLLDNLTAVDRVAIIDARSRPDLLTPAPLTDTATARLELEKLQRPDGTANLIAGVTEACKLLTQSFSTRREIVVLTDRQAISWENPDSAAWNEFLKLRQAAAVPIGLAGIDVGSPTMNQFENFQVGKLKLNRDMTVTDTVVSVSTLVGYSGSKSEADVELVWSVDGQQLSRETDSLQLKPGEEVVAELTTRFSDAGSHVITASVPDDSLPGDNVAQIVVDVLEQIPVVVAVPGSEEPQQIQGQEPESDFYLTKVFGNPDVERAWANSRRIPQGKVDAALLRETRVLFWIGPGDENTDWDMLTDFLLNGGSVVLVPDHDATESDYEVLRDSWRFEDQRVVPVRFAEKVVRREDGETRSHFDLLSFSSAWLEPFRDAEKTDLQDVLISEYWLLETPEKFDDDSTADTDDVLNPAATGAKFDSGRPWLIERNVGRGKLVVSSMAIDGQSSDLVRQRGFVPLMHEMIFGLTQTSSQRNIELDEPLIVQQLPCQPLNLTVLGPDERRLKAQRAGSGDRLTWRLGNLKLSGLYQVQVDCDGAAETSASELPFYAFADRDESETALLTAEAQQEFREAFGMNWRVNSGEVLEDLATASGGIEIWPFLLFLVTAMLIGELFITRRMVQGGHHQIEFDQQPEAEPAPEPAFAVE
ncbi:BatA domain-containing protein [Rubinisphaera margarita]|uniref:BatA domain-containing protein n=1 Tax=Rubinisphaera margarita TaxID=2909586 RepID=UPI001EE8D7A0|nr:BatA domain-containing protein [Rubinisphaera margarita]MCG6157971.1 BatA domain-containing protein [Rubinisphaera margarita]